MPRRKKTQQKTPDKISRADFFLQCQYTAKETGHENLENGQLGCNSKQS